MLAGHIYTAVISHHGIQDHDIACTSLEGNIPQDRSHGLADDDITGLGAHEQIIQYCQIIAQYDGALPFRLCIERT